jgi:hypothetical protein
LRGALVDDRERTEQDGGAHPEGTERDGRRGKATHRRSPDLGGARDIRRSFSDGVEGTHHAPRVFLERAR